MTVYFVSDLHLGHRAILQHTSAVPGAFRGGSTVEEHDEWVIDRLFSVKPTKRTFWWILGDVAMEPERLALLDDVPGSKRLILGNHDEFHTSVYLKHFDRVAGMVKRYGVWLTHAPLHPAELRGHPNIHGHCHHHTLRGDPRYLNVSIEWLPDHRPLSLDELRARVLKMGTIVPEMRTDHLCGFKGFGALGDICPACETERREP